jgi:hypothetical protein
MRVIVLIEDPAVIERILSWLELWHPLPACGPSPPAEAREPSAHLPSRPRHRLRPARAALAVLAVLGICLNAAKGRSICHKAAYAALGSRNHDHCDEKHRSPNRNMPEPLTFRGTDAKEFPSFGRIVEDGTHEQLLALGGHYEKLWRHQSSGFLAEDLIADVSA